MHRFHRQNSHSRCTADADAGRRRPSTRSRSTLRRAPRTTSSKPKGKWWTGGAWRRTSRLIEPCTTMLCQIFSVKAAARPMLSIWRTIIASCHIENHLCQPARSRQGYFLRKAGRDTGDKTARTTSRSRSASPRPIRVTGCGCGCCRLRLLLLPAAAATVAAASSCCCRCSLLLLQLLRRLRRRLLLPPASCGGGYSCGGGS